MLKFKHDQRAPYFMRSEILRLITYAMMDRRLARYGDGFLLDCDEHTSDKGLKW